MADIPTRLAHLLVKHFSVEPEQLADHAAVHFARDLDLDSLDMIELLMAVEEEFNIEITDEEGQPFIDDTGMIPATAMVDFEALIARKVAEVERVTSFRDGDCVIPRSKIKIKELRHARAALANSEGK